MPTSALQDFDGISYAKGAAVLKQLVAYLGDDVFLAGLRDYFQTHAYGNAALADLLAAWQRAGAADLDSWARDWLQTSGLDTLSITGSELVRQRPEGSDVTRPHTIAVAALGGDGVEVARQQVTLTGERLELQLPKDGGAALVPDADDGTWAKIRFDADWTTMATLLPTIAQPTTRVVVVNAFRDAVRSAEVDPGLALEALLETAAVDDEDVVVGSVLRFCSEVLAAGFTAVDRRPERLARLHDTARAVTESAGEGSDRQLLGFRYAIASCADAGLLRRWLDGRDLPPGLPLDPELVWSLVVRLAEVGGDADAIDRALERDPSAAGRVHAARARASLAGPGGQGGGVVGPDRAVRVPGIRAVRGGQGLLPTEPDRADEGVRVEVLRRDARHRGVPQRLGAGSDRLRRLPARSCVAGNPGAGRAHPGRGAPGGGPSVPDRRHRCAAPCGDVAAAVRVTRPVAADQSRSSTSSRSR